MKFVPVPGTDVLFCIHETRWRDYEEYAKKAKEPVDETWKDQAHDGFEIKRSAEDHPVTSVSWEDAQKFCVWLSEKEGRSYRLPTDREWSVAVGIDQSEERNPATTPANIARSQQDFPWGKELPPPPKAGNYSDESRRARAPDPRAIYLDGYDDGFPTTAPVMSFNPNPLGLFDLGGNVFEWCEDWYSKDKNSRVLRGGSWFHANKESLLSSARYQNSVDHQYKAYGFRVVLEIGAPAPSPGSETPATGPSAAPATPGALKNPFGWQPIPENPFPLPRPTRPTTPCRVVAWRLDGQPVDEAAFRQAFGGVPTEMGEVVDLSAMVSQSSRFIYPLGLQADGRVIALHQRANALLPAGLAPAVAIDGGRDIALALHQDGTVSPLFLAQSAIDERQDLVADVASWKEVARIKAGTESYTAIQSDGTPLLTGKNNQGELDLPSDFRSSIVFIQPSSSQTWLVKHVGDGLLINRIGNSPNLRPKLPLANRFFISSLYYSCDDRGRLDFCNSTTSPARHDALRGSARDIKDLVAASNNDFGYAAVREGEDQWRFWGDRKDLGGYDVKFCETQAAGCWKVFFIGDYVLALKPVANLKPDDWTGVGAAP